MHEKKSRETVIAFEYHATFLWNLIQLLMHEYGYSTVSSLHKCTNFLIVHSFRVVLGSRIIES